ncbi:antibiotic biosynthesis monooxygenase family protein [Hydrogenophaga sp. ZJX-1]|uniref:antibiotic biosynthesis monooxygenase family protein n=1 Tax=Hydrogenophaga sp. ZJX-1 TaxID=3404778 RepID=UPI003B2803ED
MIAVIFEVEPHEGAAPRYLDTAASLLPELQTMDGFISVERFESLARPGRYLSLSFWRDETAVRAWREQDHHRAAQQAGRSAVFADYRLRVAAVLRDYGLYERTQAPEDSRAALR